MPGARSAAHRDRLVVLLAGFVATIAFATIYLPFLPTARGGLGHDYSYFLPQLLAGSYWIEENGAFSIPWFTPAWLGGVPFYPNPQNLYHSLPQQLCAFVDPLTAVRTTFLAFFVVGFSGAYRLARSAFSISRPAAALCAVLFAFNGYFAHRMLIGHVVYHTVMVLPWIAHWMTRPARTRLHDVRLGALAGAGLAYLFHSADLYGLPAAAGLVVVVWLMQGAAGNTRRVPALRSAVAAATALALAAVKLVPMTALLAAFPRSGYALPGADGALGSAMLAGASIFGPAPVALAQDTLVNTPWAIQQHELEYSLSPIAAIAIAFGAFIVLRRGVRPRPLQAVMLLAALSVPLALNVHTPGWESFLKSVPLLGSSSNLLRTFTLYLVPVALAAAVLVDRALTDTRQRVVVCAFLAIAAVGWHATRDRAYYAEQWYDPARVVAAWETTDATGRVPAISRFVIERDEVGNPTMIVGRNDALTTGASQLAAFEPVFGYRLEWFPFGDIREGAAIQETADGLNVKHPARFLYPAENGGEPGTAFPTEARSDAEAFLAYRPFRFEVPLRQTLANLVSLLGLVFVIGVVSADAWTRRRSAVEADAQSDE